MGAFPRGFSTYAEYRRFKQHDHWAGAANAGPGTAYGVAVQLTAWYKADSLGLSNGNTVTTWSDSSLSGLTLSGGVSPAFSTAQFTPGSVLGTGTQYLVNAGFTALNSLAGFTIFTVFRKTNTGTGGIMVGPASQAGLLQNSSGSLNNYVSSGNFGGYVYDDTSPHINEAVFDGAQAGNSTRLVVLKEGVAQTLTFTGTIPATTATGTGLSIGALGAGTTPWPGDIAEVLIYPSALTSGNRSTIRVALGAKYSISVTP